MFRKAVLVAMLVAGFWSSTARCDDAIHCTDQTADADARIAACTNLLGSDERGPQASSRFLVGRGLAYVRKDDYDRALADFNDAIVTDPHNADAFVQRGEAYFHKVQDELAFRDFDEAIRLEPTLGHFLTRGQRYNEAFQSDKAIADLTGAISLNGAIGPNPQITAAYIARGIAYSRF